MYERMDSVDIYYMDTDFYRDKYNEKTITRYMGFMYSRKHNCWYCIHHFCNNSYNLGAI